LVAIVEFITDMRRHGYSERSREAKRHKGVEYIEATASSEFCSTREARK